MDDEGTVFFIGVALGGLIMLTLNSQTVDTYDVVEEKEFIYKNATYKCAKTNQLVEKK